MSNLEEFKKRIELVERIAYQKVTVTALFDNICLIVDWVDEGIRQDTVTPQMEERLVDVETFLSKMVI